MCTPKRCIITESLNSKDKINFSVLQLFYEEVVFRYLRNFKYKLQEKFLYKYEHNLIFFIACL